jgi:hypothetical protein
LGRFGHEPKLLHNRSISIGRVLSICPPRQRPMSDRDIFQSHWRLP